MTRTKADILLRRKLLQHDLKSRIEWSTAFNQMHFRITSVRFTMYIWRRPTGFNEIRGMVYGKYCTSIRHLVNCNCCLLPKRYWYSNTNGDNRQTWMCNLQTYLEITGLLDCLLAITCEYIVL